MRAPSLKLPTPISSRNFVSVARQVVVLLGLALAWRTLYPTSMVSHLLSYRFRPCGPRCPPHPPTGLYSARHSLLSSLPALAAPSPPIPTFPSGRLQSDRRLPLPSGCFAIFGFGLLLPVSTPLSAFLRCCCYVLNCATAFSVLPLLSKTMLTMFLLSTRFS